MPAARASGFRGTHIQPPDHGAYSLAIARETPCLLGLYTVVALLYQALPQSKRRGSVQWPGKSGVTFSDALTAVRRWLWREGVFPQAGADTAVAKLPAHLQDLLLSALAPTM